MGRSALEDVLDGFEGCGFPEGWRARLELLESHLAAWSGRLSLGFRDPEERAHRYFGEALASARFLPLEGAALDIGSGGGSPALPLAVVRPRVSWLLTESRGRKASFLQEAVTRVGLRDVSVEARRVDRHWPTERFDVVTSRGVALRGGFLSSVRALVRPGGLHVWYSSAAVLSAAAPGLGEGWSGSGPHCLGSRSERSGWVLVCHRLPGSV